MASTYSRQAYQQTAEALLDVRRAIIMTPHILGTIHVKRTPVERAKEAGALAALDLVQQRFSRIFELDNPRFDADLFAQWSVAGKQ